jgi:hypothetical protein
MLLPPGECRRCDAIRKQEAEARRNGGGLTAAVRVNARLHAQAHPTKPDRPRWPGRTT